MMKKEKFVCDSDRGNVRESLGPADQAIKHGQQDIT
jgi:hypothetical protein